MGRMSGPTCLHMTYDQMGRCNECGADVFSTDAASRSRHVPGPVAVVDLAPILGGDGHNLRPFSVIFLTHIADCRDDPCGQCTMLRVSRLGPIDGLRQDAARELARRGAQ
jgi:hypothetical protein